MNEDMFRIGVITSTHGLKGEVKVFPTTDDPARFNSILLGCDTGVFLDGMMLGKPHNAQEAEKMLYSYKKWRCTSGEKIMQVL